MNPIMRSFVVAFMTLVTSAPIVQASDVQHSSDAKADSINLRVNQIGYLPAERKVALALTNANLAGQTFQVLTSKERKLVYNGRVGNDRGAYGDFLHVYEMDFSQLAQNGSYVVRVGNFVSPAFNVGTEPYADLLASSLRFFRVQRCGDTEPSLHGICHLKDGRVKDGPATGAVIDVAGGWHDAGDYLKFLINSGFTTMVLLAAYEQNPVAFVDGDKNRVPDILDEARIGVDWVNKLWDPHHGTLYYQVGDESDHDRWRMPEQDANLPPRPVWACQKGRGANVAGKASAVLALASVLWGNPSSHFYDPALATKYLIAAKQIYAYGKGRPAAQSSTSGFYEETTWKDDMALAAAELYRATKNKIYLNQARANAASTGDAHLLGYSDVYPLARYEIARLDPTYVQKAVSLFVTDLKAMKKYGDAERFHAAVEWFYWGSATDMTAAALEALWYEKLTGDRTYRAMATDQRDFVLGTNPWGVCFVNSAGTTWPRTPHHQVADLTRSQLIGFWDEGPMRKAEWDEIGIALHGSDPYAAFQASEALYHDDVEDYATNEPTINANAEGLALVSGFLSIP